MKKWNGRGWTWRAATYQLGRGHPILLDVSLQMSRQLQGHLTYFFPVGGFLIGWKATHQNQLTGNCVLYKNKANKEAFTKINVWFMQRSSSWDAWCVTLQLQIYVRRTWDAAAEGKTPSTGHCFGPTVTEYHRSYVDTTNISQWEVAFPTWLFVMTAIHSPCCLRWQLHQSSKLLRLRHRQHIQVIRSAYHWTDWEVSTSTSGSALKLAR